MITKLKTNQNGHKGIRVLIMGQVENLSDNNHFLCNAISIFQWVISFVFTCMNGRCTKTMLRIKIKNIIFIKVLSLY